MPHIVSALGGGRPPGGCGEARGGARQRPAMAPTDVSGEAPHPVTGVAPSRGRSFSGGTVNDCRRAPAGCRFRVGIPGRSTVDRGIFWTPQHSRACQTPDKREAGRERRFPSVTKSTRAHFSKHASRLPSLEPEVPPLLLFESASSPPPGYISDHDASPFAQARRDRPAARSGATRETVLHGGAGGLRGSLARSFRGRSRVPRLVAG